MKKKQKDIDLSFLVNWKSVNSKSFEDKIYLLPECLIQWKNYNEDWTLTNLKSFHIEQLNMFKNNDGFPRIHRKMTSDPILAQMLREKSLKLKTFQFDLETVKSMNSQNLWTEENLNHLFKQEIEKFLSV